MIKCEIGRKGRKTCHMAAIEYICIAEGEVYSAGADGFVKVRLVTH